jgi:hypothetical protein
MGFVVEEKYIQLELSVVEGSEGIDVSYKKENHVEILNITLHQPMPYDSKLRIYKNNVSGQLKNIEWSYDHSNPKLLPKPINKEELEVRAIELFKALPVYLKEKILPRVIKDF